MPSYISAPEHMFNSQANACLKTTIVAQFKSRFSLIVWHTISILSALIVTNATSHEPNEKRNQLFSIVFEICAEQI